MKTAIIAVTQNGSKTALEIRKSIDAHIFVKEHRHTLLLDDTIEEFSSLKLLIKQIIYQYDAFIFVMATGITVRMIAPYIMHKTVDPAILVVDEQGTNVISLLSGHIGGANRLCKKVAEKLGANPIITTATDVNEKMAADMIAVQLGLRIENLEQLKKINADIVANEAVPIYIDATLPKAKFYHDQLEKEQINAEIIDALSLTAEVNSAIVITEQQNFQMQNALILTPGKLVVGIGCRRGALPIEILFALQDACRKINMEVNDIVSLASTVVKKDEPGLLTVAKQLDIPLYFYENEQLQQTIERYHLDISDFVHQQIGVGNVCESTALLSSQSKKLVLRKTKYPKVTIAIAWAK